MLLPAALLAAACTSAGPDPAPGDSADAADIEQFRTQSLDFGSCQGYGTALAGQIFAVIDRTECAQLAVTRLPARGEAIGSLIVNPGGPGGSGALQAVAAAEGLKGTDIVDSFDVVGFDPRGVGASTPAIDCLSDEQSDQDGIVFPMAANQGDWTADDTETLVDQCISASAAKPCSPTSAPGMSRAIWTSCAPCWETSS
ncbi:hypothetical protein RE9425_04970 [Prescottella equi]|nr:hypothetical protein RE9425_04970 [Prescottella equi]